MSVVALVEDYLRRRHGCVDAAALDAVRRLLEQVEGGHSCLELPAGLARTALLACGAAGAPTSGSPLVLAGPLLQLRRHWQAEQELAGLIVERLAASNRQPGAAARQRLLQAFPEASRNGDHQAWAVASALLSRFTMITGGPGTGKTRVAAQLAACLLAEDPAATLLFAAPTGKAAARLREALGASPLLDEAQKRRLQAATLTLHRHLGLDPRRGEPRRGRSSPLVCDALVIDEVSMVDVELLRDALAALPATARLVLLGDRHQLASVQAGYCLGDLARLARTDPAADAVSPAWARELAACGLVPPPTGKVHPLADHLITLRRSHRFDDQRGIGALARAINAGDGATALNLLSDGAPADGAEARRLSFADLRAQAVARYRAVVAGADAAAALGAFTRFRLLAATRRGPRGVEGLNRAIEQALGLGHGPCHGRAIMVTANDPALELANGDTGVLWNGADGHLRACFPGEDRIRQLPLAQLPAYETAWAITIHKSQGSEADEVAMVLPDAGDEGGGRMLCRELLYTAVTRAKERVRLAADDEALAQAIATSAARTTGFRTALENALPGG